MVLQMKQQNHYLQSMGIQRWCDRSAVTVTNPCMIYSLTDLNQELKGLLIADMVTDKALQQQTDKLAQAISLAINLNTSSELFESPPEINSSTLNIEFVILMGEQVKQCYAENLSAQHKKVISTYALNELIQTPTLKSEVWQALQVLL